MTLAATTVLAAVACAGGSSDGPGGAGPVGDGPGFVDEAWFRERQDDYLRFATEDLDPGSPLSVLAHAERAQRDDSFDADIAEVTESDFADVFAKIDGFEDTSDFDLMYLLALWYGHGDALSDDLRTAIRPGCSPTG